MFPEPIVSIAAVHCGLSDLAAVAKTTGQPETIFHIAEPVLISVTIAFSGSGAVALLPLTPMIQVNFFARSIQQRERLELGTVNLPTQSQQFIYSPAIAVSEGLAAIGVVPDQAYHLSALVRVGATGFPALITGVIEGLLIQTYD